MFGNKCKKTGISTEFCYCEKCNVEPERIDNIHKLTKPEECDICHCMSYGVEFEDDFQSDELIICKDCLKKALEMLDG